MYLDLLATIGREIQDGDAVVHAHQFGWQKRLGDWAHACRVRPKTFLFMVAVLHKYEKITVTIPIENSQNLTTLQRDCDFETHKNVLKWSKSEPICYIKSNTKLQIQFKNIHEFIDLNALSSTKRQKSGAPDGSPFGVQTGSTREDKRRNPPLPPIGNFPKGGPTSFERTENARRQKELAKKILESNSAERMGSLTGPPSALEGVGEGAA
jgi:hypothetical protein